MASKQPTTNPPAGEQPLGVPYDSDRADRAMELYGALTRGEHDTQLNAIELAAKARKRAGLAAPRRALPADIAELPLTQQVRAGYFGVAEDMALLLEGVANRRGTLKNEEVAAKVAELKATAPTLVKGQPVRVRLDAPLNRTGEVLLGKTGTVTKVLKVRADVLFDAGQALGKFGKTAGKPTRIDIFMLEPTQPATAGTLNAATGEVTPAPAQVGPPADDAAKRAEEAALTGTPAQVGPPTDEKLIALARAARAEGVTLAELKSRFPGFDKAWVQDVKPQRAKAGNGAAVKGQPGGTQPGIAPLIDAPANGRTPRFAAVAPFVKRARLAGGPGATHEALGKRYGMSDQTAWRICHHRSYAHIAPAPADAPEPAEAGS
jgi:hypothetical protein